MGKKKAASKGGPDAADLAADATAAAAVRKFQAFQRFTAKRSSLSFHESNPRTIDQHAFKKLRDFIKREGLLTSLIVNRRLASNGFTPAQDQQLVIVGGHQRTRAMDEVSRYSPIDRSNDYEVPIDVIEVDPAREKQFLVALNNAGLQGTWDMDLLSDLLTSPGVDPLATGFDRAELAAILDEGILDEILGTAAGDQARAEAPILASLEEISLAGREAAQADRAASSANPAAPQASPTPAGPQSAIAGMKERRKEWRESVNSTDNQAKFYFVLIGQTDGEIHRLLTDLGLPPDQEFYNLQDFLERVGYIQADQSADQSAYQSADQPDDDQAAAGMESQDVSPIASS